MSGEAVFHHLRGGEGYKTLLLSHLPQSQRYFIQRSAAARPYLCPSSTPFLQRTLASRRSENESAEIKKKKNNKKTKLNEKRYPKREAANAAAKETTGCDREALKSRLRASLSKYRGVSCFSAAASEVTDVSSGESLPASLMASHFQRERDRKKKEEAFNVLP